MSKKENNPFNDVGTQTNPRATSQSIFPKIKAVGSDDFKKLCSNNGFIDKSLFIKEVLDNGADVLLITRPRRWGKSSNLNMLKTFLEIEVDEQGTPLPIEQKANPTYFKGGELEKGERFLEALKISAHEKVMKELGDHPVVMVNFKNIQCTSYETVKAGLKNAISETFKSHRYLLKSKKLTRGEKNKIDNYLLGHIGTAGLQNAVSDLMEYVNRHFQKKIWVLIDEYDNAIYRAYLNFGTNESNPNEFTKEFKEVLETFRSLMNAALKSNPTLAKGVLTGILKIAKADLLSGLNNVKTYDVLDKKYAAHYGFTQEEIDELFAKLDIPEDKKDMIKEWYNGYNYGGLTLYNPWSIMQHLADLQDDIESRPKNYWSDSGAFGVLQNLFLTDELQANIQHLLSNPYKHITNFIYSNIDLTALHTQDADMAMSLLLFTGYLNPIHPLTDLDEIEVNIPNQEVVSSFGDLIRKWAAKKLHIDESKFGRIERALISGDVSLFKQELKKFLATHTSFRIIKEGEMKLKESHYHYLMIGILSHLHSRYQIFHELESGEGYVDTLLIPRRLLCNKTQAILLEYKYVKNGKNLLQEAQSALDQMYQKKYTAKLHAKEYAHIKQAMKVGIAFHKKEVEVVWEVEEW